MLQVQVGEVSDVNSNGDNVNSPVVVSWLVKKLTNIIIVCEIKTELGTFSLTDYSKTMQCKMGIAF